MIGNHVSLKRRYTSEKHPHYSSLELIHEWFVYIQKCHNAQRPQNGGTKFDLTEQVFSYSYPRVLRVIPPAKWMHKLWPEPLSAPETLQDISFSTIGKKSSYDSPYSHQWVLTFDSKTPRLWKPSGDSCTCRSNLDRDVRPRTSSKLWQSTQITESKRPKMRTASRDSVTRQASCQHVVASLLGTTVSWIQIPWLKRFKSLTGHSKNAIAFGSPFWFSSHRSSHQVSNFWILPACL